MDIEKEIEQLQALYTDANTERVMLEARLRQVVDTPRNWPEYILAMGIVFIVVLVLPVVVWYTVIVGLAR